MIQAILLKSFGRFSLRSILSVFVLCTFERDSFAQQQSWDIILYTPPSAWKKELSGDGAVIAYKHTGKNKRDWCKINITKSTAKI
ncbi:MAG: hypothetical protein WBP58_11265 [Chitinophagaceae bacterium]